MNTPLKTRKTRPAITQLIRILLVAFVLTAGAPRHAFAQETGSITGRVFDAASGDPVPELTVEVAGTDHSAVTDVRGAFRLGRVPAGDPVVLHFEHSAYGASTDSVAVHAGESALVRVLVSRRSTPLEPVVIEIMSRDVRPALNEDAGQAVITRAEIDTLAGSQRNVMGLLNREVPGIRVSNRGTAPARFCIEFQGVTKTLQEPASVCHYPLVVVDGSRVSRRVVESVLQTLNLDDIQRIEMVRPAEAGLRYGTGSHYGVVDIRTRRGPERAQPLRTSSVASGLQARSTYNWALEPGSHPTYRTLGATLLGNAAGVALGLWLGGQCMDYDRLYQDFFFSRCGDWTTAGSRLAAVGLPILGSTLAARWAGATDVSRGDWKKTAGLATAVLLPGYILAASGLGEKESAAETIGEALISVGVPLVTTYADRFFRTIRGGVTDGR